MSSYLYYARHLSPLKDSQYDEVCNQLILKYDQLDHQHTKLVDKDALRAGTAYHLNEEDYPMLIKVAAFAWMDKGSHIECGFNSRRRRKPVEIEPEFKRRRTR